MSEIPGQRAEVIAVPSSNENGRLYRKGAVSSLLDGAVRFALRQLKNRRDDEAVRPRKIALFYVPSDDSQSLLAEFDFCVFPVPLHDLDASDESRKQNRYRREAYEPAIEKGLEVCKREFTGFLQPAIGSRKSAQPLLLPPRNFHLTGGRLEQAFRELTRGGRQWQDWEAAWLERAEVFNHDRLPGFLGKTERQTIFRDARGVVFPCARPTEMHGAQEIDLSAAVLDLREILRSMYRFGAPLPQGFHHDAQLEDGSRFHGARFDCSRKGELPVTGTHVNIYPNDFVRCP